MTFFLVLLSVSYALFTLALWAVWLRMPAGSVRSQPTAGPFITVIIPVRNEAENIGALLGDLNRQTYPSFEVIVADDASTDQTAALVRQALPTLKFRCILLPLADDRSAAPKKRAITQAVQPAQGTLIVTTDGDCRVGPNWLGTIADFHQKTAAKLISGPVTFTEAATGFDAMQTVELASLIGAGACSMAVGMPSMCNGANLCYEKTVFTEVGGFSGVDHLASGDDEFLMHKIAARYPNGIRFLKHADAIVRTGPHRSWRAFYNQRKRWASKWREYTSYGPTLLAVFIFLTNLVPILATISWLVGGVSGKIVLLVLVLKAIPEFLYLRQILVFLQKKSVVSWIVPTQFIYPFYAVFFGVVAQKKGYRWKDRTLE